MPASSNHPPTNARALSLGRLIAAGLRYHWRTNLAVALAVMAASAVSRPARCWSAIRCAAACGTCCSTNWDSIDEMLVTDRFFRTKLAEDVAAKTISSSTFQPGRAGDLRARHRRESSRLAAGLRQVAVIGSGADFWRWAAADRSSRPLAARSCSTRRWPTRSAPSVGDEVLLAHRQPSQIPADSALGRKTETIRNRRLTVSAVIPGRGPRPLCFEPQPDGAARRVRRHRNAAKTPLEQPDKVQRDLRGRARQPRAVASEAGMPPWKRSLHPKLADYGIKISEHKLGYVQLTSNRMLIEPGGRPARHRRAFADDHPQDCSPIWPTRSPPAASRFPTRRSRPSTFARRAAAGPFQNARGRADRATGRRRDRAQHLGRRRPGRQAGRRDDDHLLRAREHARRGARSRRPRSASRRSWRIEGLAADPDLTPQMPGVTDQLSIGDWDPPFPFEACARARQGRSNTGTNIARRPRRSSSLAAGPPAVVEPLWRHDGRALRAAAGADVADAGRTTGTRAGRRWASCFVPIKRLGLEAVGGTTPFDGLFHRLQPVHHGLGADAGVAAVPLGHGQARAEEIGMLRTVGLRRRKIFAVLAGEALVVTAVGSLLGVVAGVGYAWLMIMGLTTWWVGAISTPFLHLYVTPLSLAIGFVGGLIVSLLTDAVDRAAAGAHFGPRHARRPGRARTVYRRRPGRTGHAGLPPVLFVLAVVCGAMAPLVCSGEAQAGAFVGSGALVLAGGTDATSGIACGSGRHGQRRSAGSSADRPAGGCATARAIPAAARCRSA